MISTMTEVEDKTLEKEYYFAEDQTWDTETLKQLKEEYNIYFMTGGDGVIPVKVLENGLLALGSEDDGTICFIKSYGSYLNRIHLYWLENFIQDLRAAQEGYMKQLFAKAVETE